MGKRFRVVRVHIYALRISCTEFREGVEVQAPSTCSRHDKPERFSQEVTTVNSLVSSVGSGSRAVSPAIISLNLITSRSSSVPKITFDSIFHVDGKTPSQPPKIPTQGLLGVPISIILCGCECSEINHEPHPKTRGSCLTS